jgi:hypothetical protein
VFSVEVLVVDDRWIYLFYMIINTVKHSSFQLCELISQKVNTAPDNASSISKTGRTKQKKKVDT